MYNQSYMLLTACKLQIKVLLGHVVNDVKEVQSIVRETSAEQLGMMVTIDKKIDECLRHARSNSRCIEDLIVQFNVSIQL